MSTYINCIMIYHHVCSINNYNPHNFLFFMLEKVQYSPCHYEKFGLSDGEGMERLLEGLIVWQRKWDHPTEYIFWVMQLFTIVGKQLIVLVIVLQCTAHKAFYLFDCLIVHNNTKHFLIKFCGYAILYSFTAHSYVICAFMLHT